MDFTEKVKMSIEDFRKYFDDEDYEFAYGTMDFISNKPNSHKFIYNEDVIKEYAPSVLGKWVIGEEINGDMSTHTTNQVIQGRIPENQEVQYRYDEDGYLIASVDIVLSKLYSRAYEVLRDDNFRNVSIEALQGFSKETEGLTTGLYDKVVEGFNITAVTILGKKINGSVPNANVQLTQMSEDMVKDIEDKYIEYVKMSEVKDLKDDDKMSVILNKLEEINKKLEISKEETMAKNTEITKCAVSIGDDLWSKIYGALKEKYPKADGDWITSKYRIVGIYEEGTEKFTVVEEWDDSKKFKIMFTLTEEGLTLEDGLTEVKVDFVEVGQMEMFTKEEFVKFEESMKPVKEEELPKEDEDSDDEEPEEDKMACGDAEKMEELESKLAEVEAKLTTYESELVELREFKMSTLEAQKESVVQATLSQVKDFVDVETYSKFEDSGKVCKFSDINGWKNEVLASVADIALAKMSQLTSKEDGITDMGTVGLYGKATVKKGLYD